MYKKLSKDKNPKYTLFVKREIVMMTPVTRAIIYTSAKKALNIFVT